MGAIENFIAFVFVLGVMVLIHELGHFWAARYFKVRVLAFAFGFGPRLFGFKRGDTDYKVCLFPLGGFVKMAGENPGEPSGGAPDEFMAKPRWQRIIIALMGPIFNVILAFVLLVGLFMVHYERSAVQLEPPVVGYVAIDSAASRVGMLEGDLIVALNGEPVPDWESVRLIEIAAPHETLEVTVVRDSKERNFLVPIPPDEKTGIGRAGWYESTGVRFGRTTPGLPAEMAGIQQGDLLLTLNGDPVTSWRKVPDLIQQIGGGLTQIEVQRGDQVIPIEVTPVYHSAGTTSPAWRIGVELTPDNKTITTQLGLMDAVIQSYEQNFKNAKLIFAFLEGLLEQRMSPKSLEGPIGIARLSGEAARAGMPYLVSMMAAISLNLGIFNLLPIPILDGGMITILLFESLIRRDLSTVVKERILQVGLVLLMLVFGFVIYNDILKILP
ncbi:MAG: RIP metalloprotease RseP [Solibacterales bacterium]|nr:RIP metalloprotease RseP [Bryobacterales bacterium]|tara:strand:+ start:10100 stop:11422 length:1323 start_codon:yes stop_codon:yes gene_type:complete